MASTLALLAPEPLPCLSGGRTLEFAKGQVVFDSAQPPAGLYLVASGKVKLSRLADSGHVVIYDVCVAGEVFGEEALAAQPVNCVPDAVAMEDCILSFWPIALIQDRVSSQPGAAMGLARLLAQRVVNTRTRLENALTGSIPHRLAQALLVLAGKMGEPTRDGRLFMPTITHEVLAQYVGTSREIVTHYMAGFRRQRLVEYNRRTLIVYPELEEWLKS